MRGAFAPVVWSMPSDDTPTRRADADDYVTRAGLGAGTWVFGRYRLEALAGRGGMGVVWKARDERLERLVALKLLPEVVAGDPEAVRDLLRETKRCLELTHPNIVRVHDLVQDGLLAAIAMEYVDGESLAKRKASVPAGCLSVEELSPLVAQLCTALDYAHRTAKVVHRDLKPANILVTRDGVAKITDFGIARSLTDTHTRLTGRVGNTSGTLAYMSPQQLLGWDPSPADDIYALGATLYELLTGKPPFHTGDLPSQIREVKPKRLNERRAALGLPPVPKIWEETILACLAKEPKDRPPSAREVAERLRLKDQEIQPAVPAPLRERPPVGDQGQPRQSRTAGQAPATKRPSLIHYPTPEEAAREVEEAARAAEEARPAWHYPVDGSRQGWTWIHWALLVIAVGVGAYVIFYTPLVQPADVRGGIVIHTEPADAEITVGDFTAVKSPATLKDMKPGQYPMVIRLAGFEEATRTAEVKENEFTTLDVMLTRSTGTLNLTSVPTGLSVDVSGRERADRAPPLAAPQTVKTPATLKLPTGDYTLTFHRVGWPDQQQSVTVARNETKPVLVEIVGGGPEEGQAWAVPDLNLEMVYIQSGTFTMGSPNSGNGRVARESPQTWVTLTKGYWLGKTEVTQGQWEALMGSNPSFFKGEDRPVEQVSWSEAMEFCGKLTERERTAGRLPKGYAYTLPTEAQWEYACRAVTTGDYAGNLDEMAWYIRNSSNTTHPVRQKRANAWGLYDIHGNVSEWCRDWYGSYPGGSVRDPMGPSSGTLRVCRGGSWVNIAQDCRSASRDWDDPSRSVSILGFRLALSSVP